MLFMSAYRFAKQPFLDAGGLYGVAVWAPVDFLKLAGYLYKLKSDPRKQSDSRLKKAIGVVFYGGKFIATTIGICIALTASLLVGFAVMVAAGMAMTLRYLWKAGYYTGLKYGLWHGDTIDASKLSDKILNNVRKFIIKASVFIGFTLFTFFGENNGLFFDHASLGYAIIMSALSIGIYLTLFQPQPVNTASLEKCDLQDASLETSKASNEVVNELNYDEHRISPGSAPEIDVPTEHVAYNNTVLNSGSLGQVGADAYYSSYENDEFAPIAKPSGFGCGF